MLKQIAQSPLGLESTVTERDGRVPEPAICGGVEGKIVWNEIGFSDLEETALASRSLATQL
jgi:hypothetical protein